MNFLSANRIFKKQSIYSLGVFSLRLYMVSIKSPNNTLEMINTTLVNPGTPKDRRIKMVQMINPVFLIIWL